MPITIALAAGWARAFSGSALGPPLAPLADASLAIDHFSSLPVDAFYHIASHLPPHALLALSLTSRALRTTLLSPTNKDLWRNSRRALEVPDLQADDMTESQLAVLLFVRKCSLCGLQGGRSPWPFDFALRVRCCPACQRQKVAHMFEINGVARHSLSLRATVSGYRVSRVSGPGATTLRDQEIFFGRHRTRDPAPYREYIRSSILISDAYLDQHWPGSTERESLEQSPAAVRWADKRAVYCKKREKDGQALQVWFRKLEATEGST